jgi:hypothetical protein
MRLVSSAGQPAVEVDFRVWATRAVGSSDPAGNRENKRVHGFGVHGWGPPSRLGNRAARRASRIGKPNFAESFVARETLRRMRERTDSEPGQPGSRGVHTTNFRPGQPGRKSVDTTNSPVVQPAGESVFRGARRAGNRASGEWTRRTLLTGHCEAGTVVKTS